MPISLWDDSPPATWVTGVTLDPSGANVSLTQDVTANNDEGTDTLRNDADSADLASASVSDDGTTFVREEYS